MKYSKLTNLSSARKAYSGLRDGTGRPLVLDGGETKPVHPSVVRHPRIQADLQGKLLAVDVPGAVTPVAATPSPPPPPEDPPKEPEKTEPEAPSAELRELFLEAPGITEKNIDAILDAYTSIQELADAEEEDLVSAGVSKSFASRVLEWAVDQL